MNEEKQKKPSGKQAKAKPIEPKSDEKRLPTPESPSESEDYGGMNMKNFRKNLGCG